MLWLLYGIRKLISVLGFCACSSFEFLVVFFCFVFGLLVFLAIAKIRVSILYC
jgi:hypothetical protein